MRPTSIPFPWPARVAATLFLAGVALSQRPNQETFYMQVSTPHGVMAGDSKDAAHSGWIELRSVRFEARSSEGTGSGSGKSTSNSAAESSKSPRDVASGQASGKRQWGPVRATNQTDTTSQRNSAEVATQSSASGDSSASSRGTFGRRASEIVVTKITDKASPQLLKAQASGEHLPQIILEICRGGACQERLLLKDVVISSYKSAPHAADRIPSETVTFQAARIEREMPRSEANAPK